MGTAARKTYYAGSTRVAVRETTGTLYYLYDARWYDPTLGRFAQADTIVPRAGSPQSFNRYSYSLSNPLKYTDPSGHSVECGIGLSFWFC